MGAARQSATSRLSLPSDNSAPMDSSVSMGDVNGKRSRKPKTFDGYVVGKEAETDVAASGNDSYHDEEGSGHTAFQVAAPQQQMRPRAATSDNPQPKRRKSIAASVSATSSTKRHQHSSTAAAATAAAAASSSAAAAAAAAASAAVPAAATAAAAASTVDDTALPIKKVVGVQNATRKALEWLQYGDLSLLELAQSLPKLSKARVEIVMEALRAAGLVTLVRKHAPDAAGEDHVNEVYRFAAGRSPTKALEIGGGKPVALGSISKRIKASQTELAGLNNRINALKAEAAKANPEPQQVLDLLKHFMKQDKTLDEDPFYTVAFKATCTAAAKAAAKTTAAAARSAAIAQAKKKAAEDAVASAAAAAAADTRRREQEADIIKQEREAAPLPTRRKTEETAEEARKRAALVAAVASPAATTAAAAAAYSTAALTASSTAGAAASPILATAGLNGSTAAPAASPPAVAMATAETPAPFVGELGGLVVSGALSSPEGQQQ